MTVHRRASERDRVQAARALREGWVHGAVSTDTFEARLGLALTATRQEELRTLVHDLPRKAPLMRRALRALGWRGHSSAVEAPVLVLRILDEGKRGAPGPSSLLRPHL